MWGQGLPRSPDTLVLPGRVSGGPWPFLAAWPMPKEGELLWLEDLPGAQLQGARGRLGVLGWTHPQLWCLQPGSVFPGARGSTSEGLGRAGLRAVAWDARRWTPWGWQSHLSMLPAGALGTGSKPICLPGRSGRRRLSSLNCF
uniref:Uncharacterized protein n=1 Tax=Myotis myotis TaxID=51298 RepID=A0A7J7ZWT0_MYOMY|nr:hypothetical protein mMyoMyo1_009639 [Myotis myotis]